jgi:hypothetical protein
MAAVVDCSAAGCELPPNARHATHAASTTSTTNPATTM